MSFLDNTVCHIDVLGYIFSFIKKGSEYKSCLFTCKLWMTIIKEIHPNADIKMCNHLLTLLKLFPHKNWDYDRLSRNPNMTLDYVLKHPKRGWTYTAAAKYVNVGNMTILPDKISDLSGSLSENQTITWEIAINNPTLGWNWRLLSCNPSISWETIFSNLDYPWKWKYVSLNPNLTLDIVMNNSKINWTWHYIYQNPGIIIISEVIKLEKNPDLFRYISYNSSVSWSLVKENINKDWNWRILSHNMNIPISAILDHQDKSLCWKFLSKRPDLTWKLIEKNCDAPWEWRFISSNKIITPEIVNSFGKFPWNKIGLHDNPNMKHLLSRVDKAVFASVDETLTWKEIRDNPKNKEWNWKYLSENNFGKKIYKTMYEKVMDENCGCR